MAKEQISWNEMLAHTIKQIEDAKKQGKLSVVVDFEDYCDFIRIGWSDPPPLIDRLLRELGDLGYVTYAKLVKDTTLKIEWETQMVMERKEILFQSFDKIKEGLKII